MGRINITTWIDASPETCFDLSRSVEAHIQSTPGTAERAIDGVRTGLLGTGDHVTWEAVHFGCRWQMTVGITDYDRPRYFVDEMIDGPFRSMRHFHGFLPDGSGTKMIDIFSFSSPAGWAGRIVDSLVLDRYMRRLLTQRIEILKATAESR
ncbi:MAG: SRPBCC family protein [Thermomicrobiales bacterium]